MTSYHKDIIRKRTWEIVEAANDGDTISKFFDWSIMSLVLLNIIAVIAGSVESIRNNYETLLNIFEYISIFVFTVEYFARLWSCVEEKKYAGAITGRLKHSLEIMSLIDLFAILPFYLPFIGVDLRSLRVLRLLRILRIAKIGRYYSSLKLIRKVLANNKEELILTSAIMLGLLTISSTLLYYCENPAQPENFSSIPAAMWWSVATLTTVGYGDMYPITAAGKFFASIIAILGIGMFALPTGIIGAGFVQAIQEEKATNNKCPHCGRDI